nr:TspO/MBR family protein [Tessaracoccus coleopterorum]
MAGFGLLGTRVEDSSGGAFSADATLVTPAGPAFSIWSLIYLGLAAYVIWQWRARSSARAARIAWLAAVSMILNALWLGVTQVGWLWPSVVVILTLAIVLGILLHRLGETPAGSRVEAVVVDGTFGVYLGWVAVASVANVTTVLVASGVARATPWPQCSPSWFSRWRLCWERSLPAGSAGAGASRPRWPGRWRGSRSDG